MIWTDLLPAQVYDLDPLRPLPKPVECRACPNCYWGDPERAGMIDASRGGAPPAVTAPVSGE